LPDSAIASYRTLLALYPTDLRGIANFGAVYMDVCDFPRAESLYRRAIETDSTVALLFNHLATAQLNGGRYAEAERTLRDRARRFPSQQDDALIEIALEVQRGAFDSARAYSHQLLVDAGSDPGSRLEPLKALGTLALVDGHLAESDQDFESVEAAQINQGSVGGYLEAAVALAFTNIWYRHQRARGLAVLDSAIARHPLESMEPLDRDYATLAYMYALGGRPARARELLAAVLANERVPGITRGGLGIRDEGTYLRALGATELAEGKPAQAVATLRKSVKLYFCRSCTLPDLARAYELSGFPDSAIAVYQSYEIAPWSEWQNAIGDFRVTSYERLGALNEARGDTARAIAAYDEVAKLWSAADVELQPTVAMARERASSLRAGRRVAAR
jgi:tetratricopeptide (TPR) repeat protein